MTHLSADLVVFYMTISANISYALLFVYHFVKKDTNKSLMILAGCLCLAMSFVHVFSSYKDALDKASLVYYHIVMNKHLILVMLNALVVIAIFTLHRVLKVQYHYVARYLLRCICLSIALNTILHIDIVVLENREPYWLWSVYSYGENIMTVFMFCSVLVARKWSEVFQWLQSAHAH
jgi:hypothetical protein